MNINIWVIRTLNQMFISGCHSQINFLKNEVVSGKSLCDRSLL